MWNFRGDAMPFSQLYALYLKQINKIKTQQLIDLPKKANEEILRNISETTLSQKVFIVMFNRLCKNEFLQKFIKYNDYSKEIVNASYFDHFIEVAETKAFPEQQRVLASFRCLKKNETREKDANRTKFKRRRSFFSSCSSYRKGWLHFGRARLIFKPI